MSSRFAIVESGALVASEGDDVPVPWWSFTKTVLAAAALALVQQGKLALDASLPGRRYTLRQLLQHTAGVANYGGIAAYHEAVARNDEPWPIAPLLEWAEAGRLRFAPGQGWDYSNIGYHYVRQLIENVANAEWGDALARLVLDPLDIDGVRAAHTRADLQGVDMGEAKNYHPGWVYHGLLVGPLRAAALLLDRIMEGGLLPPELLGEMLTAHPLGGEVPGRPWRTHGYGLGLMIGTTPSGTTAIGHTGGGPGSVVAVDHFPASTPPRTVAAFAPGNDPARVEEFVVSRGAS